jgi:uncharacterized protein YjeT (DUF2065 family)
VRQRVSFNYERLGRTGVGECLSLKEPMEIAVEKFAVICFFLIGVSHIVQPRAWAEFFIRLREKGTTGSFINAWIHFPLGALTVAFHNVWHGIPAVLTVLGYAWVLKGFIYFVFPRYGLKVMGRVRLERAWEFVVAGFVLVAVGCLLLFSLITRGELP